MPSLHTQPHSLSYENTHRTYDSQGDDNSGIKCFNYKYCSAVLPPWWWECRENYLCTPCDMMHGPIEEKNDTECPICLNTTGCVVLRCQHPLCETCFKRCHFPKQPPQPPFPYPEIEEDYDNDMENPKWYRDYPLIKNWQKEMDNWFDTQEEKYESEKYLRCCPLCRK